MDYKEKQQAVEKLRQVLSKGFYSETELSIIAETFFENEELLTALRNFFIQLPSAESEVSILESFVKTPAYDVLYKTFLPDLSPDAPVGQSSDAWVGINTKEKMPEDSVLEMKAREIVVRYFEEQFQRMKKGKGGFRDIKLSNLIYSESKEAERAYIELSARDSIIGRVDMNLPNLRQMAFQETTKMRPEEIQKMMRINSNK